MRVLLAATLCLMAIVLPAPCALAASKPGAAPQTDDPSEKGGLEADFWAAIGAEGTTYRTFRDRLLRRGPEVVPFLEERLKQRPTWREEAMSCILLERINKKAAVDAVLGHVPQLEYIRNPHDRELVYSKALAERCRDVPMLLVEQVWKPALAPDWENPEVELKWGSGRAKSSEVRVYAAYALGWLRERRAVPALIDVICKSQAHHVDAASPFLFSACFALGQIADPRAVAVLVRTAALYEYPPAVRSASTEALKACIVDREGIAFFGRFISEQMNGDRQQYFQKIAADIERKLNTR